MRWLMQLPARVFAFVYIGMIPFYALVYAKLPRSFYHSTVLYEEAVKRDALTLEEDLQDAIKNGLRAHAENHDRPGSWEIDPSSIHVWGGNVNDGIYSFDLTFSAQSPEKKSVLNGFHVQLFPYLTTSLNDRAGSHEFMLTAAGPSGIGIRLSDICPRTAASARIDMSAAWGGDLQGYVVLNYAAQERLRGYLDAQAGFPSGASGNFARMLYLSAITITTVGFGDIVPLTNTARLLVASEAILGIIVIGFFLNAVTRGRSDSGQPQAPSTVP